MLVETEWLAGRLDDSALRVIEVDEDTTAYEKGHIRGALGWNWFVDLHDPLRRDYVDRAGLSRLLQRAGVGAETTVVLYGGNNNWFAAYAYWLLRYLGFDQAKLLNGGRKAWELEGRELVTEVPRFAPSDFEVAGGPCATRSWPSWARSPSSTCDRPRSTGASSWPYPTCPRSRPRSRATSRALSTSPGPERCERTGASRTPRSCGPSTRARPYAPSGG